MGAMGRTGRGGRVRGHLVPASSAQQGPVVL